MSLLRRVTAFVLQFAVMIMPLVGSGFRCDESAAHDTHMDMTDMLMPGMSMPGDSGDGSPDSHSDCSLPWSAGECQSMASCAPNAMSVEQPSGGGIISVAHNEPVARHLGLRSVTRAPEPPPPRA